MFGFPSVGNYKAVSYSPATGGKLTGGPNVVMTGVTQMVALAEVTFIDIHPIGGQD